MIQPLQPLKPLAPLAGPSSSGGTAKTAPGFGQALSGALHNLNDLQLQAASADQALATGSTQNVAQVMATAEKAGLALQLAVQLRDKAVSAYQQLMNMQV